MRVVVAALLAAGLLTALGLAWHLAGSRHAPYPLVDANALLAGLPGSPMRSAETPPDATRLDHLGYLVAGDVRVAAAVSSKRPANPGNLYDVDLSAKVTVLPNATRAKEVLDAEARQDRMLAAERTEVVLPRRLAADDVAVWVMRPDPYVVAQVRYGNYVIRIAAMIAPSGYFPTLADFVRALEEMDRHIKRALSDA